jgi:hypothetical protein
VGRNFRWVSHNTGAFVVEDITASAERLRIDSSGKVGIGTDSPSNFLHVKSGGANVVGVFESSDSIASIAFKDSATSSVSHVNIGADANDMFMVTGGTEKARITSSGNVGIGVTSVSEKLQVAGNITAKGTSTEDRFIEIGTGRSGNGNSFIDLVGDTTYTDYGLRAIRNNGGANATSFIQHRGTGDFTLRTDDAAATVFQTNATEAMRIDSNGDAYFGTTTDLGGQVNIASNGTSERQLVIADSDNTTGRIAIYHNGSTSTIESQGTSSTGTVQIGGATTGFATIYCTFNSTGVTIAGALSKNSGSFKIDHPLKPETHHLVHSFIEGPQADNLYSGEIELINGQAQINLDEWFGMTEGTLVALNRDFRVFTTNESDWDNVKGRIENNILTIICQNPDSNATVSWLVIGERQDKEIYESILTDDNGKIIVEPQKVTEE